MKLQILLKKLLQLHPKEIDLSLKRIQRLSSDLGNPQDKLKILSISGTNGKNSTAASVRAIFEAAGYSVDLYSSPHVKRINERFVFNGSEISDEQLFNLLSEVKKINKGQQITFFEICTAAFFLQSMRSKSDITILESGLFNRFDACSCIKRNLASILTVIGIDHLDWLPRNDRNIDRIIFEKASNLLNSKIIIAEQTNAKIIKIIKKVIKSNSSKKIIFGENFFYKKNSNGFLYKDDFGSIRLPLPNLLGDHQLSNISTAIATVRNLNFKINDAHIREGITHIDSKARLQELKKGKLKNLAPKNKLIIDSAHNVLGAESLVKYIETLGNSKNIYLILAMMKNKEHNKFIKKFKNKINSVQVCQISKEQNCILKEKLNQIVLNVGIKSACSNSIEEALKKLSAINPTGTIIVCGSIYFCGEVLNKN